MLGYLASVVLFTALTAAAGPPPPTADEMMLLQALRDRRVELDHREMELNSQSRALEQLAKRMDGELEKMTQQVAALEARLNIGEPRRKAREKRLASLVETLTTLSAKKAAPIMAAADVELVGDLLLRLGSARTASLLSAMPPAQAGRILDIVGEAKAQEEMRQKSARAARAASGEAAVGPAATAAAAADPAEPAKQ